MTTPGASLQESISRILFLFLRILSELVFILLILSEPLFIPRILFDHPSRRAHSR